ncbi:MAG: LPS-assembly protein LptD [Betaproteobacteria bacterium]|nr:LPS-assembly protein LptD [Betaproteobacteria bacterium]
MPGGFDWGLAGELTRFSADRSLYCNLSGNHSSSACLQPNAVRMVVNNQWSRPWLVPYGYVTPKVILHARQYQYDSAYLGILGNSAATQTSHAVVPTFSLDTGAVLERPAQLFGLQWTQTLEPRAFYVKTPTRSQNDLPNYDTGFNDFNFATVFTENAFSGNDRISDTHTFTMGATSRLIDPESGAEGARFGLAQRLRLSDQKVLLSPTDTPISGTYSDVLAGASFYITPRLSLDSMLQYNPLVRTAERESLAMRYNPSGYRTISAAYRHQRASSETAESAWQWPINDLWGDRGVDQRQGRGLGEQQWYSLGRFSYNLQEKRLIDSMLGLEYDAGCWVARAAVTRNQISLTNATTRLMFQLELNDFSKVGVGGVSAFRDNISRYQHLREPFKLAPSRFGQYD